MSNDLLKCRVCGLIQDEPPWGDDGATPMYEICDCCGVEFGYEDATPLGVARYRQAWLDAGAKWNNRKRLPGSWDLEAQLVSIPQQWKAVVVE